MREQLELFPGYQSFHQEFWMLQLFYDLIQEGWVVGGRAGRLYEFTPPS